MRRTNLFAWTFPHPMLDALDARHQSLVDGGWNTAFFTPAIDGTIDEIDLGDRPPFQALERRSYEICLLALLTIHQTSSIASQGIFRPVQGRVSLPSSSSFFHVVLLRGAHRSDLRDSGGHRAPRVLAPTSALHDSASCLCIRWRVDEPSRGCCARDKAGEHSGWEIRLKMSDGQEFVPRSWLFSKSDFIFTAECAVL